MKKSVTLIGMGCGPGTVSREALFAIDKAGLIIGSRRMLELLPGDISSEVICEYRCERLEAIIVESDIECIAVLFSGDTGLYSGAPGLYQRLMTRDIAVRMIPGISVVACFAAHIGSAWRDWDIVSSHGRDMGFLHEMDWERPVFILTSDGEEAKRLCEQVEALEGEFIITVGERLGYEDERITVYPAGTGVFDVPDKLNVLLVERV